MSIWKLARSFLLCVALVFAWSHFIAPNRGWAQSSNANEQFARGRRLNEQGVALYKEGNLAGAEAAYREALAILEKTSGPVSQAVASVLHNLAVLYRSLGQFARAEESYQRTLSIREQMQASDNLYLPTLNELAGFYYNLGRYDRAEELYRRVVAIETKLSGDDSRGVAMNLANLGNLYQIRGRYGEAQQHFQRALLIL